MSPKLKLLCLTAAGALIALLAVRGTDLLQQRAGREVVAAREPLPLSVLSLEHVRYDPTLAHERVATCIAKRYQLNKEVARKLVQLADEAGAPHELKGNLILAIAATESSFHPLKVSPVGALGLMQVLPKAHRGKLARHGDEHAWLDPQVNMQVGAEILAKLIRQTRSLEGGLAAYVGAGPDPEHPYVARVKYELELYNDCAKGIPRRLMVAAPSMTGAPDEAAELPVDLDTPAASDDS